ncbi:dihydrolipoamide acetyltransferase [Mycoplasmopsis pullorum]|uniref:2-oxo acid dehydrogenase subunit E2 n=1 Tax=Mycoplasmopsis pullorum TaxID=48003 RepID=UPI00111AF499|nr:2-oxo acid dehydrogenase subunit E2 [Mycoplasmopsis pullorum]TNK81742.1 dihydrolipoamide acetyltransferase [Mycoplasmopsis pullorum]TNK83032.1 dihydrolipoamide acetyltransferase [Mycoplasmopsis pullorum]TNK84429.1 dihydrolipoamide acetyltransferase [Mycoplasmopsis pullorum]TNK85202.1 dihydrolipoamide acetyltransferase [Mycoplasmopsis pullorum]TNK86000.1 dihydrolipoamide acetyltransferase [Mycoplasmopsis pullorum]
MSKIKSTPLARAMAAKLGINIENVKGTGIGGRILIDDIKNFKAPTATPVVQASAPVTSQSAPAAAPIAPVKPTLEAHSEAVTPIRKAIAKAMTNSWSNVAYTNLVHEIDMTRLWDIRSSIKDLVLKSENVKLTFLPYILKAVAIALKEFPKFLAKYNEQAQTLEYPGNVNLGFAVDTEAGLMVPVINDANRLSIVELASEVSRLASVARKRTIKPAEMKGAGFTVTNYGSVGSLWGVPVINYPELAIAGVGAIIDKPVVKNGAVVPGKVMYLTVAGDHRWIDGAEIGRFASRVKELLENPEVLGVY